MYQTGRGVDPDPAQAVFWYQRAAAAGNARAQANLGNLYLAGIGVPQDNAVAANWFELAARQGHVVSQFNLGLMYENGIGVAVTRRRNSCWGVCTGTGREFRLSRAVELLEMWVELR